MVYKIFFLFIIITLDVLIAKEDIKGIECPDTSGISNIRFLSQVNSYTAKNCADFKIKECSNFDYATCLEQMWIGATDDVRSVFKFVESACDAAVNYYKNTSWQQMCQDGFDVCLTGSAYVICPSIAITKDLVKNKDFLNFISTAERFASDSDFRQSKIDSLRKTIQKISGEFADLPSEISSYFNNLNFYRFDSGPVLGFMCNLAGNVGYDAVMMALTGGAGITVNTLKGAKYLNQFRKLLAILKRENKLFSRIKDNDVWKRLLDKGSYYPDTLIPQIFKVKVGNIGIFVTNNATKHIHEHITSLAFKSNELRKIATQIRLDSLTLAIERAVKENSGDKLFEGNGSGNIIIEGWELSFSSPRNQGELPALKHARMLWE